MPVFTGLSAFPITPADPQGRVKTDELSDLVARLKAAKVNSVGLLGSTGIYMYLPRDERRRAIECAAKTLQSELPLIVGIGALRTTDVIINASDAAEAGANGLLLAPVSYAPLTDQEVFEHFKAVAKSTDLPITIYNNPSTTNFSFSSELLGQLLALPNIVAAKMPLPVEGSVATDISRLRKALPEESLIGYSGDWGCAEALLAGADCWYSVIGGILPKLSAKLTQSAKSGNQEETEKLNSQLEPIWALFKEFGSLRVVYAIAKQLSIISVPPPLPILPISSAAETRVDQALMRLETLE